MTEHERIDQIEQSLAGLEKQLYSLKAELRDLKQTKTAESIAATVTAADTVPVKPATTAASVSGTPKPVASAASVSNTPKPVSEPAFTASAAPAKASSAAANQAEIGRAHV